VGGWVGGVFGDVDTIQLDCLISKRGFSKSIGNLSAS
jgi:hypothetical protein